MSVQPIVAPAFDRLYALRSAKGLLFGLYTQERAEDILRRFPEDNDTLVAYSSTPVRPDIAPEFAAYTLDIDTREGEFHTPAATRMEAVSCADPTRHARHCVAHVYPVPTCALFGGADCIDTAIPSPWGSLQLHRPDMPFTSQEAAIVRATWAGLATAARLAADTITDRAQADVFFDTLFDAGKKVLTDSVAAIAALPAAPASAT